MATGYTNGDPSKLDRAGGTMTGPLVLAGPPTAPLHAATKDYVDTRPGGGGGGSGGYRGAYNPATAYLAGDIVTLGRASYGTAAGAAAGIRPVTTTALLAGTPAELAVADGGDYELGIRFTVSKIMRMANGCFYKSALQTATPHLLKLWDVTAAPSLIIQALASDAPGDLGVQRAPMARDVLPGRVYILSLVTGTGSDSGYVRTPADAWPKAAGSVTADTALFSAVIGGMNAPTLVTTNFWVFPEWEEPDAAWDLLGRHDPVGV